MFFLEQFEAKLREAGFGELLKRQEKGVLPNGRVRLLCLDDIDDDSIGAQTDDFERSVYRVGVGLALSDEKERLFQISVDWRVYDVDGLCGIHVGKLQARESINLNILLCPAGGVVREIYLEGESFENSERIQRERHQSLACIDRFVSLYKRAYDSLRA